MKTFRENVLKYGSLILIFILPLISFSNDFYPYMSSKTFLLYGFISILFPIWIYTIYIDKSYRLSKKQLVFFAIPTFYIIWMTVSGIFAMNPHISLWSTLERGTGLLTLYSSLFFSLIIASIVKRDGKSYLYKLFKWFILSSFILAVSVWLGDEGFNLSMSVFKNSSGGGFMGNSSLTAACLIFSLFLSIYFIFSKEANKFWKISSLVLIMAIIFSPLFLNTYGLLTNKGLLGSSRGALIGIIVGLGIMLLSYLALSKNKIIKILGILGIFISLIIFSIGWVSLMKPNTYLHEKFTQVASGTRFIFWDVAQKSMNEHPFFGYGPENYYVAFQDHFNPDMLKDEYGHETGTDRAHNIYFDTGVSGGYPAIILYSVTLLSIMYALYLLYKKDKISKIQICVLWGLIGAYIFQGLFVFDSTISIFYLYILIGFVYGLLDDSIILEKIKSKKTKSDDQKFLDGTIAVVLLISGVSSFIYFYIMPASKSKLYESVSVINPIQKDKTYLYKSLLDGSSVGIDRDVSGLADSVFKVYTKADLSKLKANEKAMPALEKDTKAMLDYLEEVAKTNKTDFRLQIGIIRFYSIYYYLTGKEVDIATSNHVLDVIKKAHDLSPTNPEVYWWSAQVYAWQANLGAVVDSYMKAIALNPTLPTSHRMFINFAKDLGNKKLYDDAMKEAEKDIPGFKLENNK